MGTAEEVVLLGGSAAAPSLLPLWGQIWQPRGWAGGVCGVWPNHPGYSQTPAWTTPNFGGTASSRLYHTGGGCWCHRRSPGHGEARWRWPEGLNLLLLSSLSNPSTLPKSCSVLGAGAGAFSALAAMPDAWHSACGGAERGTHPSTT